jgi:hypothetical protein
MGNVKGASIIHKELTDSSPQSGSKFGIGSSLTEISPMNEIPGSGGGCEGCASCRGTSCGSNYNCEFVCASGCGASNVLKVK